MHCCIVEHSPNCQSKTCHESPRKRRRAASKDPDRCVVRNKRRSKLFQAVIDMCKACILDELRRGGDINARDVDGYTPLMIAVEMGRLDMIGFLLDQGANPELRNNWGETALFLAVAQQGKDVLAMVQKLLASGWSVVNTPSTSGCVPLFRVAGKYHDVPLTMGIILELVHANADLDIKGSDPDVLNGRLMTSFELAATVGNFRVCRLLYDAGCDVSSVHEWIRRKNYPRLLTKDRKWLETIVTWATEPRSLQELCRIRIRRVIGSNCYDVRHHLTDLGLPSRLAQLLLIDEQN